MNCKSSLLIRKRKERRLPLRVIAASLVVCFFAQDAAFAAPELAGWLARPAALSVELPRSIATVESAHDAGPGSATIYLVQDAHANESAQRNIAEVIRRLSEAKSARVVFLEGGTGDDSLSFLRRYGTPQLRRRLAESYLKRGYLQGADYLDLISDTPLRLWGVEDPSLYFASLERYRRLVEARPRLEALVESVNRAVRTLKPQTYGALLSRLDRSREDFLANRSALTDYLGFLRDQAVRQGVPLDGYRQIREFDGLKQAEAAIDFERASREQIDLVRSLPADKQALLARAAAASSHEPSRVGSDDPKREDAFYAILEESSGGLKRYPALAGYVAYLRKASALDAAALVREKDELETRLMDLAAAGKEERRLLEIARSAELLERLFTLRLSREDFRRVETGLESFDLVTMTGALNRALFDLADHHEDVVFLQPDYDAAFTAAKEFYELTEARDRVFLERINRKMRAERLSGAVLVAGGYHSTNLKDLLARAGYSYVSILPAVTEETNQPKYEQLLLGQLTPASSRPANGHIGIVVGREFVLPVSKPNRARPRLVHVLQKELGATPKARASLEETPAPAAAEPPGAAPSGARLAADPAVRALLRDWRRAAAAFESTDKNVEQLIQGLIRLHDRTPLGMYRLRGELVGIIRPLETAVRKSGSAADGPILRVRDELARISGWNLRDKFKKPIISQKNKSEALLAKRMQVWAVLDTTDASAEQRRDAFRLADGETRSAWLRLSVTGSLSALDAAVQRLPSSGRLRERTDELRRSVAAWLAGGRTEPASAAPIQTALQALSVNEGVWPDTRKLLAESARHLGRAIELAEVIEEGKHPRYFYEDNGQMAFDLDSGARLASAEQVRGLREFLRGQIRDFDRRAQKAGLTDSRLATLLDAADPGEKHLDQLFKTLNLNRGQRQSILAWTRRQQEAARLEAAGPVFDGEAWVTGRLRPVIESLWARAAQGLDRQTVLAELEPLARELDPAADLDAAANPQPVFRQDDIYGLVVKTITPGLLERGTYLGRPTSIRSAEMIREGRIPLLTARVVGTRRITTPDGHAAVIYRIHDPSTPERPGLFGAAQAAQDRFIVEPVDTVRGAGMVATVAKQLEAFVPAFQEIRRLIGPDLSASPVTPPFLNHPLHRTGFHFLSGLSAQQAFEQLFWATAGAEEVNHFDAFRFAFARLEARGIPRRTVEADIPAVAAELLRDDRPGNPFRAALEQTDPANRPAVALAIIELEARLKALSLDDTAVNPYPAYTLMTYGGAQHGVYALVSHFIVQALAPEIGMPPTMAAFEQGLLPQIAQNPGPRNAQLRQIAKSAYAKYFWTTQERRQIRSAPASGARLSGAAGSPAAAFEPGVDWLEEVGSMTRAEGARLSTGPLDPLWLHGQLVEERLYLDTILGTFHAEVLQSLEAAGQKLDEPTAALARESVELYYLRAFFLALSSQPRADIDALTSTPEGVAGLEKAVQYFKRSPDPYGRRLDHPDVFRMILEAEGADTARLPEVLAYFRRSAVHFNHYLSHTGDYHYEDLSRQYQLNPRQLRRLIQKLYRRQQQAGLIYRPDKFYRGFRQRRLSGESSRRAPERLPENLERPVIIHNASFASGATINHPHQQVLFLEKDFLVERMAGVERAMWDHPRKLHWYDESSGVRFGEFFGWPGTVAVVEAADYWEPRTDRAAARVRLTARVHELKERFLAAGLTFNAYLSVAPDLSPRYLIFPRRKSEVARKPIPEQFKDSWSAQAMAGMFAARDADEYRGLRVRDVLRGFDTENPGRVHRILGLPAPAATAEVLRPLGESQMGDYLDAFLVPARSNKTQPKALATAKPPGSFLYYYWPVGEKGMRLGGGFSLVPNVRPFTPEHWVIITDGTGVQEITPEAIANSLEIWDNIVSPQIRTLGGARLAASDPGLSDLVDQLRRKLRQTPYHSPRFDPAAFADLVGRIEAVEIASGDKHPDDFFTVDYQGKSYPIHPYRTEVPGARPASRYDVTRTDGETVRNTAWFRDLTGLVERAAAGKRGPVTVAIVGRPGSGKTFLSGILERVGIPGFATAGQVATLHTDEHLVDTERGAALNVSEVIYRSRSLDPEIRLLVIEGVHAADAFGPRKLADKPDVTVFVRTADDDRLRWERILSREPSRQNWRGPEYFLNSALVRDIEQRYTIDPLSAVADLVVDTSVSAQAGARLAETDGPAEREVFESPEGPSGVVERRGLLGYLAAALRIPRAWVASRLETRAIQAAREALGRSKVSYTGSIVRYTPSTFFEEGEDPFGSQPVSIAPLKQYRPTQPVSDVRDGRTTWVAAERHAIFIPDAALRRGDTILTTHSYSCSLCYGRLTTPDGKVVHMMSHQDPYSFGRVTLSVLEKLFEEGKIVTAELVPLAYGTDRTFVENELDQFAPHLRDRLRPRLGDAVDRLRVIRHPVEDKQYGTALTFTKTADGAYLHDWSFWGSNFGDEATVVDWGQAWPALVARFAPAETAGFPAAGTLERPTPRAPPDGSVGPGSGIYVEETDSLSGARLSEVFRNFVPEQNPIPEQIDRIPVSTAILVMLPTAGGHKKVGEADMLSIWMGRLFEEIERLDAEAERRGERIHVEVVIGENSDLSDKPEVLGILHELMRRYKEETRSGRGLRMTVLNLPPKIGKSATVNELHREAQRRYRAENQRRSSRGVPPLKMYLHFMDDDSYLAERKDADGNELSQILSNLDLLRDEERSRAMVRDLWGEEGRLKAVGTTPVRPQIVMARAPEFTWLDVLLLRPVTDWIGRVWTFAFQHVSNIRKENLGVPLAQIYGQSYTMDIDDYPAGGIPIDTGVDDCFLSIWLKHIVTNPDAEHEHAEPATLDVFIRRYWRDRAHGRSLDSLAQDLGQADLAADFQRVRRASHDRWTQRFLERHPWYSLARFLNLTNYLLKSLLDWLYDHGWAPKQYYDLRFGFVRGANIGNVRLVGTRVGSERGFHIVTPQGVITMPTELLWTTLEVMGLDANLNARLTRAEVEGRLLSGLGDLPDRDLEALRATLAQVWAAAGRQPQEEITVQDFVHALSENRQLEQSAGWRYLGDYLRRRKIVLLFDMVHNSDNWLVSRAALTRLDNFIREEAHEDELGYLAALSANSNRPLLPQLAAVILDRAREYPGALRIGGRPLRITARRGQRVWVAVDPASGQTFALTQTDSAEDRLLNRWSRLAGEEAFAPSSAYDAALGVRVTPLLGRQGPGYTTMSFHQYASQPHGLTEWAGVVARVARTVEKLHEAGYVYGEIRRLNALADVNLSDPSDLRIHITGAGPYEWNAHLPKEADLFGLGSLLYFGFAYRDPFVRPLPDGEDYLPLTGVPTELNRIIRKALGKSADPYTSAAQMAADLEQLQRQLRNPNPNDVSVFEGVPVDRAVTDLSSSLGIPGLREALGLDWEDGDFVLRRPEALPRWTESQLRTLLTYQHHRPGQRWQYVRLATALLTETLRRDPSAFESVWQQAVDGAQTLQPLVAREVLNAAMAVQRSRPDRWFLFGSERLRVESSVGLDTYRVHDVSGTPWILKITDPREQGHTAAASPDLLHPRAPYDSSLGGLLVRYVPSGLLDGVDPARLDHFETTVARFAQAARRLAAAQARGVVHRDALAHNFRIESDGRTVTPIDFGLSETASDNDAVPHLERSDTMVLAAALEQALSGQARWIPLSHGFARPAGGPGERPNPSLPPFLSEVIRGGIDRQWSIEEFADELERAHQQLVEPRYTSPFDGRSMQQQLQMVYDLSLDQMSAARRPSAGARLSQQGTPLSAKDRIVLDWLADWKRRPDPLEVARAIREDGLTEWDILRAARKAGLDEPRMHQTFTELDSLVPYLLAAAGEALERYGDHRMLLLGRDAENVYDVLRVLLNAAGRSGQIRLFPGSMDFWRLPKPFDRIDTQEERALKTRFFESFGVSRQAIETGERFLVLDTGFSGTVAEEVQRALAALYGWSPDDPRLRESLVSRLVSSQNKFMQLVRFRTDDDALDRAPANFPKSSLVYPARDADTFEFLIGTALQLLPRWHDVYAVIEETPDGILARPAAPAPLRDGLDDPVSPNDSIVHPLAALLVQHRLVSRLLADLESGRLAVRSQEGRLRLEAPDLPIVPRAGSGARLSAGKTVLVYDADEIQGLLSARTDKLKVLYSIHDKLYGPMRETARQILAATPGRIKDEALLRGVLSQLFVAIVENAIDAYLEGRLESPGDDQPLRIEVEVFHPDGAGRIVVRLSANGLAYRPQVRRTQQKRDGTLPALGGRGEGLLNVQRRLRLLDRRSRWRLVDRRPLLGDTDGSVFEWTFLSRRIDGILQNARRYDLGGIQSVDGGYARLTDEAARLRRSLPAAQEDGSWSEALGDALNALSGVDPVVVRAELDEAAVEAVYRGLWAELIRALRNTRAANQDAWSVLGPDVERLAVALGSENGFTWDFWEHRFHALAAYEAVAQVSTRLREGAAEDAGARQYLRQLLAFERELGERALSIVDWDGGVTAAWLPSLREALRHDQQVRVLSPESRSDLRVAERHLARLEILSGARLSARRDDGALERQEALERFLAKHRVRGRLNPDGTVYEATPVPAIRATLDSLRPALGGDLRGKRLLDIGAGDLRVSLAAAALYGMNVTAVEKDPYLAERARRILVDAVREGIVREGDIRLPGPTDVLRVPLEGIDAGIFYYTEPSGEEASMRFRRALEDKWLIEASPQAVLAMMFTGGQVGYDFHRFDRLAAAWPSPLPIYPSLDGIYLQLYRSSGGARLSSDSQGWGLVPYNPALDQHLRAVRQFYEQTDEIASRLRESLAGIDERVTRLIYPGAHYDTETILALLRVMPNVRDIRLISYYDPPGASADTRGHQARLEDNLRRAAAARGIDTSGVTVRIHNGSYFDADAAPGPAPQGGLTVVIDKYPGRDSSMRLDPRYRASILRDTRPGDVVVSRVDHLARRLEWSAPPLAEGLTFPYLYHHQNRWTVQLLSSGDYGAAPLSGARLADSADTPILFPFNAPEAVRVLSGAFKTIPVRTQIQERLLTARELLPGQRSLHLGNSASLLPVLEGLMGLTVFATDIEPTGLSFVQHVIRATEMDLMIRGTGGTFVADSLDIRYLGEYRPGVLFDHVVMIDVFSGVNGLWGRSWYPSLIQLVMEQLVDKLAPGATVLTSGAGIVTDFDGAGYLDRVLERRGIRYDSRSISGEVPRDTADTALWLFRLASNQPPPASMRPRSGARLAVSDLSQRGGRLNEVHRRLRDELLVPYLTAAGVAAADAAVIANTLTRARPGLLDYYRQTGLLTRSEAGLLAEIAENRTLDDGQPLLDRLERLALRDNALGRRIRERVEGYADYPAGQRAALVERLVPVSEIRSLVSSGVPEWVVFGALRTRFHLLPRMDEARRFVQAHQERTGGPAVAWQFVLFYGLDEGPERFDEAESWVAANQDTIGGSTNAWKFLLAHNLETADRILARSRAWVRRHQGKVGGPANAWQIVISYGLKGAGPFVKRAGKWVDRQQDLVGGPANAWRIVTRQGLSGAGAFVTAGRLWVDAQQAVVGGTQNAWRIFVAQGSSGAGAFVAAARPWVLANQAAVGGERNAWEIVIKQGVAGASDWVAARRPAVDLDVASGASLAKAWFTQIGNAAPEGARLALDNPIGELALERSPSRRLALARRLGLDVRPAEAGLLDPVYIGHDMAVKDVVNPDDKPLTVVYGGSGVDLSNLFLSTNAGTAYLVDQAGPDLEEIRAQLGSLPPVVTPAALEYLDQKRRHGHAVTDVDGVHDPARALALEFDALGVRGRDIRSVRQIDDRTVEIKFSWAYKGRESAERTIYLTQGDITDPGHYPAPLRKALDGGIDVYYQRAPMAIPTRYDRFVWEIGASVRRGGFFVTDDFTYRGGEYGLVDLSPKIRGLGFGVRPELSPERLRDFGLAVLGARKNILRTHQLHPPYEMFYGFEVIIRQRSAGARLAAGRADIVYDDERLTELLLLAQDKTEALIEIHGTLFNPLLPVAEELIGLSGATDGGQAAGLREFLTGLLVPVVENAVDAYLERRADDPTYTEPLRISVEALRFGGERIGVRLVANGSAYNPDERKTELKRSGQVPALGGRGVGLLLVQRKTLIADADTGRWSLADRRPLLGDEDGSVFEWSFAAPRMRNVLDNVLFFGHGGARLSWASQARQVDASLERAEALMRRAALRAAEPPDGDGVESQRILAARALRRLNEAARAAERLGLPVWDSIRRRQVEAAILEGHSLLRRGNLKSASGDPSALEDYEAALKAYEEGIEGDDGSRKGRIVADGSFVEKATAIHHFKAAASSAARWRRTREPAALLEAVALYEKSRQEFKGSVWMAKSARREYVKDGVRTEDLDASVAAAERSVARIDRRLEKLRRLSGEESASGARLAAPASGPWHRRPTVERIDHELVRQNLLEIRESLGAINSDLEYDRRIDPEDLSDQAIDQYGQAVAHLNRFLDRENHTPERLERAYRAFHYALAKRGLIRKPGAYDVYDHHAEEVGRVFRWLFTDQAQRRIENDPVAVAAHVFTTLVNLQPFHDGNKRTASLIANFILIKGGYQPFLLSENNAARWAAVVYPADDRIEISAREFRDFLEDEVFPARGARLAAGRADAQAVRLFARDHAAALEAFVLELWRSQGNKLGQPFALETAPGSAAVWTLEASADSASLSLRVEGLPEPVLVIDDARSRLAALRAKPKDEAESLTAQGAVAMLRLARMRAQMHFAETPRAAVPLAFEIPAALLDGIRDPEEFEAQVRMLVSQVAELSEDARTRANVYYLSGVGDDERGRAIRSAIEGAGADSPLKIGAPPGFRGITVRLVDSAVPPVAAAAGTIYLPVRGIRAGALLGWNQALVAGTAAGAFYGNYFDAASNTVDFGRVRADELPEALFGFYNVHASNKLPDRGKLVDLFSGRASPEDFEAYGFNLPVVERIPVNLLLAAARQMYRAVSAAA